MPRKKSNLNNKYSKNARRMRANRANESQEQIAARNAAQRIRTAEIRRHESREQRDERLRRNILRTRLARERHKATFRERDRERQKASRALRLRESECTHDVNYSAHAEITIGEKDKIRQALKPRNETNGLDSGYKIADDIDIEEHDVLDNPRIKTIFPDITCIKIEAIDYEHEDINAMSSRGPQ
ncbi:cyclin-dependent kinase 11B-like [Melitaea cinxia]|uniref:cyclin-dependent kinase 11B-like n=1 Tax=Melitaea cinxia TaxID=113334 RepID=UPI001E26F5A3|nr:cyclin-dependent kinase 11B-like [Melitaea cinxia]